MRPTRVRGGAIGAALLLVGVLVALVGPPASAHATLVDSSPRDGQRLAELPSQVRFEFNQDMSAPAYVIVTAPDGSSVTTGRPRVDGPVVSQEITTGSEGTYTMAYRAVSEDGHPVTGEITFSVGTAGARGGGQRTGSVGSDADSATSSAPSSEQSFLSRHGVAVGVGVGLFVLAGSLWQLSRRTPQ